MVESVLKDFGSIGWQAIHVWQRDVAQPGWNGFEPGQSILAATIASLFRDRLKQTGDARPVLPHGLESHGSVKEPEIELAANGGLQSLEPGYSDSPAQVDESGIPIAMDATTTRSEPIPQNARVDRILEIIIDEPHRWWIASKVAQQSYDYWPGGVPDLYQPLEVISRAYFKIAEAFAWSGLQIRPGERVVEIGASPGGACQWLLDAGARVTGIDPAEMEPSLLTHPHFNHWRGRSKQVKRRAFREFRILACDANVAPNYTLDTVEAIVTYPTSRFRALVLTIKMPEWELAQSIPEHIERVRSWGFSHVAARQLAHNRREYCLVAKGRIRVANSEILAKDEHTISSEILIENAPTDPADVFLTDPFDSSDQTEQ
jgi:23S rRNA (cytidine2498-2'-O)-methyltransferase